MKPKRAKLFYILILLIFVNFGCGVSHEDSYLASLEPTMSVKKKNLIANGFEWKRFEDFYSLERTFEDSLTVVFFFEDLNERPFSKFWEYPCDCKTTISEIITFGQSRGLRLAENQNVLNTVSFHSSSSSLIYYANLNDSDSLSCLLTIRVQRNNHDS